MEGGGDSCKLTAVHLTSTLQEAILLVGPTGAGKTPLGEWLELHGLWRRRCHHFDFGANLREVAAGTATGFTAQEVRFIQDVIVKGALLEDENFHLALKILQEFVSERHVQADDLLVMNGLPRHIGQAHAIAQHLRFVAVIDLQCDAETIYARLHRNTGGDRTDRTDDSITLVQHKLGVFAERTKPLLAFYEERGVPLIHVRAGKSTLPSEIVLATEKNAPQSAKLRS